ncbi:MAG: 16S rRNA (cytidine(1402)-2'-O)-methyltransferase [Eubacteriales bacterium]|nr:16S rRNA (cytidine(1402)-2'-O)-methyltransferase [Eubacteriales bacterium]
MSDSRELTGKLSIVATPIGNLGDMSPRAVEALKNADIIAAEDTRNSIKLLNHFDIKVPMESYHEFNKYDKADELVAKLSDGKNIAIITDAGTPCISDPGEILVDKCHEAGIPVTSVPGPSAVITALTLSGLSTRRFIFEGFLPARKQKKEREKVLSSLINQTATMVLYEAPHHLTDTLKDLAAILGEDRRIVLCREMTKLHEEVVRTTLGEAVFMEPRGEYVLVIEGKDETQVKEEKEALMSEMTIEEHMDMYLKKGMDNKSAMKAVARDRGLQKRDIYNYLNNTGEK